MHVVSLSSAMVMGDIRADADGLILNQTVGL
jgi:hypothetical protein